jgi:phosphate starvation-inducible membrane PsiE
MPRLIGVEHHPKMGVIAQNNKPFLMLCALLIVNFPLLIVYQLAWPGPSTIPYLF